jgi:predicted DNA-binding antitoxin AbrB/MazE fold protein
MTHSIRAIFENGVFRPLDALTLTEHEEVRLTVEPISSSSEAKPESDTTDPLADIRSSTGIADLAEHFDDFRFGRRHP